MIERPNLFQLATEELSQDAFLTWLLQWAAPMQRANDRHLSECDRQFVALLLNEKPNFKVTSIKAGRQWNNVDVWAEINSNTLLLIEDKKHAGQHGGQLETYRAMAGAWCEHPERGQPWRLVCVYLKTGNEAASGLAVIQRKGYNTVGRAALVALFEQHRLITNEIFLDFLAYLNALDGAAAGYLNKPWNHWHNGDWEGFYLWLDTQSGVQKDKWFWVDNSSGGF